MPHLQHPSSTAPVEPLVLYAVMPFPQSDEDLSNAIECLEPDAAQNYSRLSPRKSLYAGARMAAVRVTQALRSEVEMQAKIERAHKRASRPAQSWQRP
jgi:hypothetical protein